MVMAQNRGIFATVAVFALIFVLIAASFTSCTASLQGASSAIISTSYSSTDEDIYAAENAYRALEEALNTQINQMESTHPDYDEYRYQIDEIGHNPYHLISYLTVKYGGFTYEEVAEEIKEIFRQQYGITTDSTRETVTETKTVRVGESLGQVVTVDTVTARSAVGSGVADRQPVGRCRQQTIRLPWMQRTHLCRSEHM